MRARILIAALVSFAGLATSAAAIPYIPPPQPVYDAPIDRALQNVVAMDGVDEAQRERVLGRLNLLAYARNDGTFTYIREGDQFNEAGSIACTEVVQGRGAPPPNGKPQTFSPGARCAQWSFALGPQDELPANPSATNEAARERLVAAEAHYARAITLEGANLRARLGHAYTLDRLGRISAARNELRTIIRLGLPQLAAPQSDWETHAVLTETAEHMAHLARSGIDRRKLAQLRARLQASRPIVYVTPIVVPLNDAPFAQIVDDNSNVAFDLAGTGDTRAQGWITPNAAWLVWDPQWRGDIRSGFDLIGQRTWAVFWSDGFEALRALDDNRDGELTGGELGGLALWRDENMNGVSDPGEVLPANVHGIAALATRGAPARPGLITAPAGVRFEDGRTRPLYDWTPGRLAPSS
ncbi:hemolysin-type calcium binding protein [alpha proteobacterium U9-1i]|nr:hemolysin-type calcium binding protein [alpha proteobacterium U9-1i]